MTTSPCRSRQTGHAGRALLAAAAVLLSGSVFGQAINDVPMAVKNNVAPNFIFMLDNSGSMNNLVPTAPYDAAVDYTPSGCTNVLAAGSSVLLSLSSGAPRIKMNGTSTVYRHWSLASSGSDRRCFKRTAEYDAYLVTGTQYLGAAYDGNYLNWYFGNADGHPTTGWTTRKRVNSGSVQSRLEIAKASATAAISSLPVDNTSPVVRVGLSNYNGSDGGQLVEAMAGLTTTHRSDVLATVAAMTGTGNTPLSETLADIGRYLATGYSGNITAGTVTGVSINNFLKQNSRQSCLKNSTGSGSTSNFCAQSSESDGVPSSPSIGTVLRPIQYWCQRSYAFLLTDGRPQADQDLSSNTYLRDYDGDCSGALASNCTSGSPNYDRKLSRQYESEGSDYLDDVAKALFDVDLRPNLVSPDPVLRPKKNNLVTYTIGFADKEVLNDPLLVNTASQGGGRSLFPTNASELTGAFNTVIADAFSKDAAAAAVAVANAQITLNNIGYASSYKSGAWYGDLVAYSLDTTTALQTGDDDLWSLRVSLKSQAPSTRKIATYNGSSGTTFTDTLSYTGKPATLTAEVINYLRGDRTGEGTTYRTRQDVLGDIINAEPVVVNYSGGVPIIFQGANDGMLHVVDGRTDAAVSTRGHELWAYVPKLLHADLYRLTEKTYAHRYFVDGTPATAKVTGFGFSDLLVGGLGKGGRGYYALNISSYAAADAAAVASKVLWEFNPANMGYSFGTPLIVKTAAGWRVIVASGYDNGSNAGGDGVGRIWIIDPSSSNPNASAIEISTGVGSAANPSGLAHISRLANASADSLVRYVWGGDLKGNVWRFDLDTATVLRIASITDAGGALAEPITAPPEIGPVAGSSTKFMVYIGTGRYLADEDVPGASANAWATQRQSIYGLIDDTSKTVAADALIGNLRGNNGATCPSGGGDGSLVCQTLTYVSDSNTYTATHHAVDVTARRGWYIDLPQDAQLSNGRVVSKPALTTGGTLTLTVNIPTDERCDPGGRSWFLALNGATGGAIPRTVGGNTYHDTVGTFLGYALASRPVIVTTADGKRALIRMSDKTVKAPPVQETASTSASWRRIYWRQVK